jgi:pimeloyl-ACP methyl ester carboxylesterase
MSEYITNQNGEKIFVQVEHANNPQSVAIIMHGLGGNSESSYIKLINNSCQEQHLTTVRFDCRNTYGKSDGSLEKATVTNHLEDLQTVIDWCKKQEWFIQPYLLFAHSLGGLSILEYAKDNQAELFGIAPLSSVLAGELSWQTKKYSPEVLKSWKELGYREWEGNYSHKKLEYAHKLDRDKYDARTYAHTFTIPVLMIVGTDDDSTPVEHQQQFQRELHSDNELHVIPDMKHSPSEQYSAELDRIIQAWIHKLLMRSTYEK